MEDRAKACVSAALAVTAGLRCLPAVGLGSRGRTVSLMGSLAKQARQEQGLEQP